jgi:hypothetical protein
MSIKARREYLIAIRERYKKSSKKEKGLILDEFCSVCGYDRNYAIRILGSLQLPRRLKPGRKPIYGPEVTRHLIALWKLTGMICSKNLKAAIPDWIGFYAKEHALSERTKKLLLQMSAATMDRHLRPEKVRYPKRISTTSSGPGNWIKNNIPLKKLDHKVTKPGHVEADTVSHCGDSAVGPFVSSLTITDVYSDWTENRAVWRKVAENVVDALKDIDEALPFEMREYTADNGTEVLNKEVKSYLQNRAGHRVNPKRGRPYKKNDNCFVEQKNWTHVRSIFGYERIDDKIFVPLMNEIYKVYWGPLKNFFTPTRKMESKRRSGSRVVKQYGQPKTPYQRLVESEALSAGQKYKLRQRKETMNPLYLRRELDRKLASILRLIDLEASKKKAIEKSAS